MKVWYWAAVGHAPPTAQVTLEKITVERVDLYYHVPPLGENISVSIEPFLEEDSVPTEDDTKGSEAATKSPLHGPLRDAG